MSYLLVRMRAGRRGWELGRTHPALRWGGLDGAFEVLGRGGVAVLGESGGLRWDPQSPRTDDVYVHVVDQELLDGHIDRLLVAG